MAVPCTSKRRRFPFCCMLQAGAKHVYGVECSAIAEQAKEIVKVNGYEDRVTIIHKKLEDMELPVDKVIDKLPMNITSSAPRNPLLPNLPVTAPFAHRRNVYPCCL